MTFLERKYLEMKVQHEIVSFLFEESNSFES